MDTMSVESPAVHSYLNILQGVISRMAAGSSTCKTWCITLVSAIMVVVALAGKPDSIWIGLIPIAVFLFLDSYYLAMERLFRQRYDDFIRRVQNGTVEINDTFVVKPCDDHGPHFSAIAQTASSLSIWPFYGMLLIMLPMARYLVFPN